MTNLLLELPTMNEAELIEAYHSAARDLSYFNAGEGSDWSRESKARYACQDRYGNIRNELAKRGLPIPTGNYLI